MFSASLLLASGTIATFQKVSDGWSNFGFEEVVEIRKGSHAELDDDGRGDHGRLADADGR